MRVKSAGVSRQNRAPAVLAGCPNALPKASVAQQAHAQRVAAGDVRVGHFGIRFVADVYRFHRDLRFARIEGTEW